MARHGGEGGHVPIEVIAGGVQKLANHLVERADDVNVALEEGKYANGQKFKERDEATLELVVKRGEVIKEFADLAKLPGKPVKPRAARYSRQNPGVRRAS